MRDKLWTGLSVLVALAFLMAGAGKLAGAEELVANFQRWGYPLWFLTVTGVIEVLSAILLVPRKTRVFGALTLAATMVGAVGTHLIAGELGGTVPAAVLLGLTSLLAWAHRDTALALIGKGPAANKAAPQGA